MTRDKQKKVQYRAIALQNLYVSPRAIPGTFVCSAQVSSIKTSVTLVKILFSIFLFDWCFVLFSWLFLSHDSGYHHGGVINHQS